MIDIKLLRENPQAARASQHARGEDEGIVDAILAADERRRSSLSEFERLRAEQKATSKTVGQVMGRLGAAKKSGAPAEDVAALEREANEARRAAGDLSDRVKGLQAAAEEAEGELATLMRRMPNLVIEGVPAGGEEDFVELTTAGPAPRDFAAEGFEPRDHLDIAERLGIIDMARGVKVAESRFYYMVGQGARLENALMQLALQTAYDNGFTQIGVPTLVNPTVMAGAGFLDAHADEVYKLGTDELYLTGTSEVALAGYHADEIIDLSNGPRRYTALSTCYRREAGSYGKDTRGIIRVHQFQKVEMFVYCRPEDAQAEHEQTGLDEERLPQPDAEDQRHRRHKEQDQPALEADGVGHAHPPRPARDPEAAFEGLEHRVERDVPQQGHGRGHDRHGERGPAAVAERRQDPGGEEDGEQLEDHRVDHAAQQGRPEHAAAHERVPASRATRHVGGRRRRGVDARAGAVGLGHGAQPRAGAAGRRIRRDRPPAVVAPR